MRSILRSLLTQLGAITTGIRRSTVEAYPKGALRNLDSTDAGACSSEDLGLLRPVATIRSFDEWNTYCSSAAATSALSIEQNLIEEHAQDDSYHVDGYCLVCARQSSFLVDRLSGAQDLGSYWIPNWRERLEWPNCKLNNRQRLIAALLASEVQRREPARTVVYFMEQVTSIFSWAQVALAPHEVKGSEYLGHEVIGGTVVNGIRHEDIQRLSLASESVDVIVSNDVFEHIPIPEQGFYECVRILKPGGTLLMTIPFHWGAQSSVSRSVLGVGGVVHHHPPLYHGNPVDENGPWYSLTSVGMSCNVPKPKALQISSAKYILRQSMVIWGEGNSSSAP